MQAQNLISVCLARHDVSHTRKVYARCRLAKAMPRARQRCPVNLGEHRFVGCPLSHHFRTYSPAADRNMSMSTNMQHPPAATCRSPLAQSQMLRIPHSKPPLRPRMPISSNQVRTRLLSCRTYRPPPITTTGEQATSACPMIPLEECLVVGHSAIFQCQQELERHHLWYPFRNHMPDCHPRSYRVLAFRLRRLPTGSTHTRD